VPTTLSRSASPALRLGYGRAALHHHTPLTVVTPDLRTDAARAVARLATAPIDAAPVTGAELTTDQLVAELLRMHAARESDDAYILPL
jgi:hypothetical protein